MQTGLECIGNIGAYEVAEVVLLALKSLEEITDDYILDISYMDIILSVLSDAGLDNQQTSKHWENKTLLFHTEVCWL